MRVRRLLRSTSSLRCDSVQIDNGLARIQVASTRGTCSCPCCGRQSSRVHSWYERRLSDLPWHGLEVRICWRSRRFFCDNADCSRRIFVERLPEVAAVRARRTTRLELTLRMIALACGGEPGARLADRLGMKASGDSLLRILRSSCAVKASRPRVIGVDDWAYRRGRRYGTLLCDLETHRPIDLLPDRSADSFHAWLVQHPDVRVVARDRGEYYARGATSGAPQAVQVADRWHLLRNLSDALKRLTDRYPRQIAEAWQVVNQLPPSRLPATNPNASPPISEEPIRNNRDAQRRAHYDQVHQLHKQGHAQRSIARQLGINRETVQRYLRANAFPERAIPGRRTPLCRFRAELWRHWSTGRRNAAELFRELAGAGFQGSYHMVTRCIRQWRQQFPVQDATPPAQPPVRRPSARRVAWLLTRSEAELSTDDAALIEKLQSLCPDVASARNLALRFVAIVRDRQGDVLDAWIAAATAAASPRDLQGLAQGLQSDLAAVRAALELPWSNGQTEGHVHRLKALKRQMYGRANFDLLRIRVLNAA